MSAHLERLKAEEEALEAQMLGNQSAEPEEQAELQDAEDSTTGNEELPEYTEDSDDDETQEYDGQQPIEIQEEEYTEEEPSGQPRGQRTNWKKRFINFKKSTDATIHSLRKELMDLQDHNARLMKENYNLRTAKQEVQGDVFDGIFTQEDEDTFGTEGLDIVKRATQQIIERQVKPLQEELRRHEKDRLDENLNRTKAQRVAAYQEFLNKLEQLVPEYAELNVNKNFLAWMDQPDPFSGDPRSKLFRNAEKAGDVLRVADFFLQYREETKPKKPSIPRDVQRYVTPVGTGGGSSGTQNRGKKALYYRESDINKFYNDVMKGRYAGQHDKVLSTEKAIEQAMREGRILRGQ